MVFVLIVSGVISAVLIAFVLRSIALVSESNEPVVSQRADVFTNVCKNILISDLRNEMKAGSFDPLNPDAASPPKVISEGGSKLILYPKTPFSAVPTRMTLRAGDGLAIAEPNLLKWSSRDAPFFLEPVSGSHFLSSYFPPAPPAAPVSTAERSLNSKSVSPELWRMPRLLTGSSGMSLTPDWVLVSSKGKRLRALPSDSSDPITGRYAFVMYDEGGLLDVNIAGFPSIADSVDHWWRYEQGLKGGVGFADLAVLFRHAGFTEERAGILSNEFLRWRHDGFSRGFVSGGYGVKYRDYLLGERLGFLAGIPLGGRGLVSRRSTIQVFERLLSSENSKVDSFLQFVGTFSRDVNQPSLRPDLRRPAVRSLSERGNDLAGWDPACASPPQHVNPPFLQVVLSSSTAATSGTESASTTYGTRSDGSPMRAGQQLVTKRFPLSRLSMIAAGSVAVQGSSIERIFGLTRSSAEDPWVYSECGPNGIRTLYEVAGLRGAQSREPNFVELLKAGISVGAIAPNLGSVPGATATGTSVDEAVIQIAANIIDQFDADGFPTRIILPSRAASPSQEAREFSGIESLPYLYEVRTLLTPLRQSSPSSPFVGPDPSQPESFFSQKPILDPGAAWVWQQVSLWNPHAQAVPGAVGLGVPAVTVVGGSPVQFRVVAECSEPVSLWAMRVNSMKYAGITVPTGGTVPQVSGVKIAGEQLRFKLQENPLNAFHQPTFLLGEDHVRSVSVEIGADNLAASTGIGNDTGSACLGVAVAQVPRISSLPVQHDGVVENLAAYPEFYEAHPDGKPTAEVIVNYRLEYLRSEQGGTEDWVAYDRKSFVFIGPAFWLQDAGQFFEDSRAMTCPPGVSRFLAPDPRTDRFGYFLNNQGVDATVDNRFGTDPLRFYKNLPNAAHAYADPDGVIRRASGYLALNPPTQSEPLARPVVLNRPFRSVAELGYAFSGVPWRQLDFVTPESGFSGLLDLFCINENQQPRALERGRVNLNTRQAPVIEALLSRAYLDELNPLGGALEPGDARTGVSAKLIARALVDRTSSVEAGKGPITNLSELVGRLAGPQSGGILSGADAYRGFAFDLEGLFAGNPMYRSSERARHSVMRALADSGTVRVWNLLIDMVVQIGRYPPRGASAPAPKNAFEAAFQKASGASGGSAIPLSAFHVEAEKHLWWHVAIDRLTGEVLDESVEFIEN